MANGGTGHTITFKGDDQVSPTFDKVASSAESMAAAQETANGKITASIRDTNLESKARLTVGQKVKIALMEEAGATDKVSAQLAKHERAAAMAAQKIKLYAKANKPIPKRLLKQVNASNKASKAMKKTGKSAGGLAGILKGKLAGATSGAAGGFSSMVGPAGKMGAAVLAGAAALAKLAIAAAAVGDKIDKASARTGVSVENIQRFGFAAQQSGASAQDMENGLLNLSKRALTGGKSFEKWGIAVEGADGKTKGTTQLMMEAAEMIKNLESPLERAAAAQDIFGGSGKALMPMLAAGADGIQRMALEADDAGAVLGEGFTNDSARLTDSVGRLTTTMGALWNKIAHYLMPVVNDAIDGFQTMAKWVSKLIPTMGKAAKPMDDYTKSAQKAAKASKEFATEYKRTHSDAYRRATAFQKRRSVERQKLDGLAKRDLEKASKFREQRQARAETAVTKMKQSQLKRRESMILAADRFDAQQQDKAAARARAANDKMMQDAEAMGAAFGDIAQTVSGEMSTMFGEMIDGSKSADQAFSDAMANMGKSLLKKAADYVISKGIELAIDQVVGAAKMLINASVASGEAATAVAGIPVVGPALAIAAAVAVFAGVMAMQAFEQGGIVQGGTPGVDSVPILAQQGEAVLPVQLTKYLMSAAAASEGGTFIGGKSVTVNNVTHHTTLKSITPPTVEWNRLERRQSKTNKRLAQRGIL